MLHFVRSLPALQRTETGSLSGERRHAFPRTPQFAPARRTPLPGRVRAEDTTCTPVGGSRAPPVASARGATVPDPMARIRSTYVCGECGGEQARWFGRCPDCGAFATLVEQAPASEDARSGARRKGAAAGVVVPLASVETTAAARIGTGIAELDRVLGGGLVPGSIVLLGGEPGRRQVEPDGGHARRDRRPAAGAAGGRRGVAGAGAAARRAHRRDRRASACWPRPSSRRSARRSRRRLPRSASSTRSRRSGTSSSRAAPGSVSQVRESAARLQRLAKARNICIVLIGHVTKEGVVAGPRVLEHLVDVVLMFEGDALRSLRVLRAQKNRFGATDEIGLFEMSDRGLVSVTDASRLHDRADLDRPGSCTFVAMEGTRPLHDRRAGARGAQRAGDAAAARERLRPQPPVAAARRAGAPRRARARAARRVRQRRRRRARRRAGRRPRRRPGARLGGARRRARPGVRVRRDRADGPPAARDAA